MTEQTCQLLRLRDSKGKADGKEAGKNYKICELRWTQINNLLLRKQARCHCASNPFFGLYSGMISYT